MYMTIRNWTLGMMWILFAGTALHAAEPADVPAPLPGQDKSFSLKVGELDRDYWIHLPKGYDPKAGPVPVVLMLHGAGGSAEGTLKRYGWAQKSDQEDFIAVFPEAEKVFPNLPASFAMNPRVWNDGSGRAAQGKRNVDDVGYIRAVIGDVVAKWHVDERRIYVTGFSSGASMTHRLGVELADKVAAVAPVSGHLFLKDVTPSQLVSYLLIAGTADPLNPIDGGPGVSPWGGKPAPKPAMKEGVERWRRFIGASDQAQVVKDQDGVRIIRYAPDATTQPKADGDAGLEAIYCTVEGMGHSWPGCIEALPESIVGKTSNKISATDMAWDFFKRHAK